MSAVPLHRSAHVGAGSRPAGQRYGQRAAGDLSLLRRRQRVAADEQTLPVAARRLSDRLPLAG